MCMYIYKFIVLGIPLRWPRRMQRAKRGGYTLEGVGCNMEVNAHPDEAPCSTEKTDKSHDFQIENQGKSNA